MQCKYMSTWQKRNGSGETCTVIRRGVATCKSMERNEAGKAVMLAADKVSEAQGRVITNSYTPLNTYCERWARTRWRRRRRKHSSSFIWLNLLTDWKKVEPFSRIRWDGPIWCTFLSWVGMCMSQWCIYHLISLYKKAYQKLIVWGEMPVFEDYHSQFYTKSYLLV